MEKRYPEIVSFNVEGAKVLPPAVVKEVRQAATVEILLIVFGSIPFRTGGAKVLPPAVVKEVRPSCMCMADFLV